MVLMLPAISAQRFVIGGLECDLAMFLILTLTPTCLVVLTCIAGAGKGGMLDIEEELRRMHSAGKGKRRPPSGAGDAGGAVAALTQQVENFFITSEACTVNYFHRHFHWFANVLFSDELSAPTAVILAEGDQFIAVERVRASLEAAMAKNEAAAPGLSPGTAVSS